MDVAGHDAYLALVRGYDAGAVRADKPGVRALHEPPDLDHVQDRYALGDADDELYSRVDRLHYGVGGEARGDIYDRGVGPGLFYRVPDSVEHRYAVDIGAALAGRDSPDHLRAVGYHLPRVEGALLASYS